LFPFNEEECKEVLIASAVGYDGWQGYENLNQGLEERAWRRAKKRLCTDDAVIKLVYLALRNISAKWDLPIRDWASAINRFAIIFEGRIPIK
jgi:putative transposase